VIYRLHESSGIHLELLEQCLLHSDKTCAVATYTMCSIFGRSGRPAMMLRPGFGAISTLSADYLE